MEVINHRPLRIMPELGHEIVSLCVVLGIYQDNPPIFRCLLRFVQVSPLILKGGNPWQELDLSHLTPRFISVHVIQYALAEKDHSVSL